MIKTIVVACLSLFSVSALACANALPTDNPYFCSSFKSTASCYCTSSGLPGGMCQDMKVLYSLMISRFNTIENACLYQQNQLHYTTVQDCLDNWNCYLKGGVDSRGRICNSTYKACQ